MHKHLAALSLHQVAAKKHEISIGILDLQLPHQIRGVQIAGRLPRYQKILHLEKMER